MTENNKMNDKFAKEQRRILITDRMHPSFMNELKLNGFEYVYRPNITQIETYSVIGKYSGLVVNSKLKLDKKFIDKAKKLKFIARAGSGMENIDVNYLMERKIKVISSPEGNSNAVAEHAVGMLLGLLNNIHKADREVRKKIWLREENRGVELEGKTVGVIGFGNTGSAFAGKLKGFNVKILAYDKYKKKFGNEEVKEVSLKKIFSEADILSFHIPLTEETKFMVNDEFLMCFRKKIILINTSRGKILKTSALIKAMEIGNVTGAALDVFENENLGELNENQEKDFQYLINSRKVILTPHLAGWSFESKEKIAKTLLKKIMQIINL